MQRRNLQGFNYLSHQPDVIIGRPRAYQPRYIRSPSADDTNNIDHWNNSNNGPEEDSETRLQRNSFMFLFCFGSFLLLGLFLLLRSNLQSAATLDRHIPSSCDGDYCYHDSEIETESNYYSSSSSSFSSSSTNNGGTTFVGIILVLILVTIGFLTCGRSGNGSRDAGEAHRVYPPSTFVLAAFTPIVGSAIVGAFFFGFVGFLIFAFFGVLAAYLTLNWLSSAPEVAGGGAYIKS